ncbi:MAG: hypothetical protein ACPIOQ_56390 [Promethearchaeia archaeon]
MAATQGDFLMQAKARNQFGAKSIHGTANRTGGLIGEKEYEGPGVNDAYDNDASFDQFLNSNSAAYFQNPEDKEAYGENRWKSGGGVDTGGARGIQALGKSRDEDGTVDRVRDPPQELLPLLYALRMQCSSYNIDLYDTLQAAGGSHYGTIPISKFSSALVVALNRFPLTEKILADIAAHYGCGAQSPAGSVYQNGQWVKQLVHECIAWQDFVEDVMKAQDVADTPTRNARYPGGPPSMGR